MYLWYIPTYHKLITVGVGFVTIGARFFGDVFVLEIKRTYCVSEVVGILRIRVTLRGHGCVRYTSWDISSVGEHLPCK